MKTIGIIGGVGPSTTAAFYMRIIQLVREFNGERPRLLIHNVPVPAKMEDHFLRTGEGIENFVPLLQQAAISLQNGGVDLIVMACNSLHHLSNEIRQVIHIPFHSIVDASVQHLQREEVKRVGILGSPLTLQQSLYGEALSGCGIEFIVPNKEDQSTLGTIIRNIVFGKKGENDEQKFMNVMNNLQKLHLNHLLLACTDLQELKSRHPECITHDTMEILAQAVCKMANE